jgi:hypothetical protein
MDIPPNPKLKTIEAVMLTSLVRRCLDRPETGLVDWEVAALVGAPSAAGCSRGLALFQSAAIPYAFCLIVKR